MSSTNLFSYKMKKGQWAKTDSLTESDIAVIIDVDLEIFWFWEGPYSNTRDRYNARQILGQLRKRYTSYKFKRINEEASESVKDKIEALQIRALAKKKKDKKYKLKNISTIVHSIDLINAILIIITIVFLMGIFFQSEVFLPNLAINKMYFNLTLLISSIISLISFILFIISAIYMGIARNLQLTIISIIGCCLIFVPFFMLRIWDTLLITNSINEQYLIQNDAIGFFIFNLDIFFVLSIICSLTIGILGIMNITFIKKTENILNE